MPICPMFCWNWNFGPSLQGSWKVIITDVLGASLTIFLTLQRWWQITLNIKGGLPRIQILRVIFIDDLMCWQGKVQRFLVCNWIAINNSSLSCLNYFDLHRPRQPRGVPREIAFLKLPQAVVFFHEAGRGGLFTANACSWGWVAVSWIYSYIY